LFGEANPTKALRGDGTAPPLPLKLEQFQSNIWLVRMDKLVIKLLDFKTKMDYFDLGNAKPDFHGNDLERPRRPLGWPALFWP